LSSSEPQEHSTDLGDAMPRSVLSFAAGVGAWDRSVVRHQNTSWAPMRKTRGGTIEDGAAKRELEIVSLV
jgi:hypothetical protein